jgi:hypothetical protein
MGESRSAAETPKEEPRWVIIRTFADDESLRAAFKGSDFATDVEKAIEIVADAERRGDATEE